MKTLAAAFILSLTVLSTAFGQFLTPIIDGSISASEYGTHADGQNQQANGSQTWYMTWDATNLYIAVASANLSEGAVLYIESSPLTPINGGTNSDGNSAGFNYDNTNFAALQFRADAVFYFKDGYREYRTANGSGGWSSATAGFGSYGSGAGDVRELAIPWSVLGGRPAAFAWFGYVTSPGGFVYGEVPTENNSGFIGTSARDERYYLVSNTDDGASTAPFSRNSFVFNRTTDATGVGAISVYDFTMNSSGRSITRASGTGGEWTIAGSLRCDNGTISFGSSETVVDVSGSIVVGAGGSLSLSSAAGGDLIARQSVGIDGSYSPSSGTLKFMGGGFWSSASPATDFGNVVIENAGSFLSLGSSVQCSDLTILSGQVRCNAQTLDVNGHLTVTSGTLNAFGSTIQVSGDWTLGGGGTFISTGSSVMLDGGSQSIGGSNMFNDLSKSVTVASTLTFVASSLTVTTGTLSLHGSSGQLLSVQSSSSGNQFNLDVQGSSNVDYVRVKDSDASAGNLVTATNSVDDGNNENWNFGSSSVLISAFSPTHAPPQAFVTIEGSDLGSVTDVKFNGVSSPSVEIISPSSIKVVVPAGATTGKISVYSAAGNDTSSGDFTVDANRLYQLPAISSFSWTHVSTGDGRPDIVAAGQDGSTSSSRVTLWTDNDDDGVLEAQMNYFLGHSQGGLTGPPAVADLDGDGRMDIVTAVNNGSGVGSVIFLKSDSLPSSPGGVAYQFAWNTIQDLGPVVTGTAQSDTATIIIVTTQPGGGQVSKLRLTKDYDTATPSFTTINIGPVINGIVTNADPNEPWRTGNICIATADGIYVYQHNTSDLDFLNSQTLGSGISYPLIATGDVNGDGHPDIVAMPSTGDSLHIYLGDPLVPNAFVTGRYVLRAGVPLRVATGDLDGDGRAEISIDEPGVHRSVSIFRDTTAAGDMTMSFERVDMDDCDDGDPTGIAIGDIDRDGYEDVVVAGCSSTNKIIPLLNSLTPKASLAGSYVTLNGRNLGDVSTVWLNDTSVTPTEATSTTVKLIVPVAMDKEVRFTVQSPNGFASTTDTFTVLDNAIIIPPSVDSLKVLRVATGDVNGDGHPDVVTVHKSTEGGGTTYRLVSHLRSVSGGGILIPQVNATVVVRYKLMDSSEDPCDLAIADFNGDGLEDVSIAIDEPGVHRTQLYVLLADSTIPGTFITKFRWTQVSGPPARVATGDVDGDGRADIACLVDGAIEDSIFILLNDPLDPGSMRNILVGDAQPMISDFGLAKRPGTNILDIVDVRDHAVGKKRYELESYFENGDVPTADQFYRIAVGDVTGDGIPDVVGFTADSGEINILRGLGDGEYGSVEYAGKLQSGFIYATAPNTTPRIIDVDEDGRGDIAIDEPGVHLTVYFSKGDTGAISGNFFEGVTVSGTGTDNRRVAVGDITGDGAPDIVVAGLTNEIVHPPLFDDISSNAYVAGQTIRIGGSNFECVNEVYFGLEANDQYKLQSGFIYATAPASGSPMISPAAGKGNNFGPASITGQGGRIRISCPSGTCITADALPDLSPPNSPSVRTFVVPHILEKSGRITNTQNTFDTDMFMVYSGGKLGISDGGGATVDVYLYDDSTGEPLQGLSSVVCNPCRFELSSSQAQRQVSIDELITTNGGGFDSQVKTTYAVLLVGGSDPDMVNIECKTTNAHTGPADVSSYNIPPRDVNNFLDSTSTNPTQRTYVIPHILEKEGLTSTDGSTFDTEMFMTYSGGSLHFPDDTGATVDLYLYGDGGSPLMNSGAVVCNPCTYQMNESRRKESIRIDDLITRNGPFDAAVKLGFGVIVVSGQDPDAVKLQGFVVNSHSGPFDLSVFGFEPQPIAASASIQPKTQQRGGQSLNPKTYVIPHVLETSGKITNTPFTFDTQIFMTYAGGLGGTSGGGSEIVNLYLLDSATSQPMVGANGSDICNPCQYTLSSSNRKQSIRIDDLITSNGGGFDVSRKSGFAILEGPGELGEVAIQAFVVNSHSGPFDLSFTPSNPQILAAIDSPSPDLEPDVYVLPHLMVTEGLESQFTFDTEILASYSGGHGGGGGTGATVSLFVYDQATGLPMQSSLGTDVCNPCNYAVSQEKVKLRQGLKLEIGGLAASKSQNRDAIASNGTIKTGFAIIVVGGDKDNVNLTSFVTNTHTNAFDLSVFGFDPQPIAAAASVPIPVITIEPAVLDFGTVQVKDSSERSITLRNTGEAPLVIDGSMSNDPDFTFSGATPIILAPGESATETVVFRPHRGEVKRSSLQFSSNAGSIEAELIGVGSDTIKYRSFSADSIALDRDLKGKVGKYIKRTADKVEFKFNLGWRIGSLKLKFPMLTSGAVRLGKDKQTIPVFAWTNLKEIIVPADSLTSGFGGVIQVDGFGFKGKPISVQYFFLNSSGGVIVKGTLPKLPAASGDTIKFNQPRLPMPNRVNALLETFEQGAFASTGGLLVGHNRKTPPPDSSKYYAWLQSPKYTDVLKTLYEKGTVHTVISKKGYDYYKSLRLMKGQQKSLPPSKYENRLLAELVALDVNIAASAAEKTPVGFGELIYDDGTTNPLNGMMVRQIASVGDDLMMGSWDFEFEERFFADTGSFGNLERTVARINNAFEGTLDTISFTGKLRFTGLRSAEDVGFLHTNPSENPARIISSNMIPQVPSAYALHQNYPNPFNPTTTISFDVPELSIASLTVYNLLGQEVMRVLDRAEVDEGTQEIMFDASNLSSGVYFYRLVVEPVVEPVELDEDEEAPAPSRGLYQSVGKMMLVR